MIGVDNHDEFGKNDDRAPISRFFTAGGALRPNSPSYVKRPADDKLFDRVMSGEFCYILTPRQMGKSSLMVRTARRLEEQGVRTAVIDLTAIGREISAEQWYLGLLTELKRKLGLSVDPETWWQAHASLGRVQRFTDFLRNVILREIEGQVVIFIDEIDTTLQIGFTDDFFAAIRAMYNARANYLEYERLTFVLLGVATPSDLIKDRTRTPFNIGHSITLQEFTRTDASVLQTGLEEAHPGQGEVILDSIFYWTDGHPYLTQKLCLSTVEAGSEAWDNERVDNLVQRLFLSEEARGEANLQRVRDGIQTSSNRRRLLKLYRQVYEGEEVADDDRALDKNRLKLLGLIKPENGVLKVRNEIYRHVFNLDWIKANTPADWPRYIAIALVVITVLLSGVFGYITFISPQQLDASQAEIFISNFRQATSPDLRVTNLSNLFLIPGFEDQARELFFSELTFEEQVLLFEKANAEALGDRVIIIVKGLYTHVDDNPAGNQLLLVMAQTLRRVEGDLAKKLATEIEQWLKGREHADQKDFEYAVKLYGKAIDELNPDNIGLRFDRALAHTELGRYEDALTDLDAVLGIVSRAPPTPTPTPTSSPTTILSTSTATSTVLTLTSTFVSSPTSTPTPTAMISMPLSSAQRFTNSEQIADSVEEIISTNESLLSALFANQSRYPNLSQIAVAFGRYPYHLGRPVTCSPNCGTTGIRGTVYDVNNQRVGGLLVKVWADGWCCAEKETSDQVPYEVLLGPIDLPIMIVTFGWLGKPDLG